MVSNLDDKQWFREHLKELGREYESKLVAVLNGRVVAVGDDLEELARLIEKKKKSGEIRGAPYTGRVGKDIAAVHIPSVQV